MLKYILYAYNIQYSFISSFLCIPTAQVCKRKTDLRPSYRNCIQSCCIFCNSKSCVLNPKYLPPTSKCFFFLIWKSNPIILFVWSMFCWQIWVFYFFVMKWIELTNWKLCFQVQKFCNPISVCKWKTFWWPQLSLNNTFEWFNNFYWLLPLCSYQAPNTV